MFSNARTYARTHKELLTLSNHLPLSNAHRGAAENSSAEGEISRLSDELAALVPALQTDPSRYPVIRNRHTAQRAPISRADRLFVYERDHFRCAQCGSPENLTLDHITPWSAGGIDDVDNLRTLCWPCNEHRSNFNLIDDDWRPLPLTFCCVDCDSDLPLDHPSVCPTFCWWCRHESLGSRSRWFTENQAFWDYDINWHREGTRKEWEQAHA